MGTDPTGRRSSRTRGRGLQGEHGESLPAPWMPDAPVRLKARASGVALMTVLLTLAVFVAPATADDELHARLLRIAYNSDWPPYSYGEDQVRGILPMLLEAVIHDKMGVSVQHYGFPWKRVQKYVKEGKMDAFFTYPSSERLEYAVRSRNVVYLIEMKAFVRKGSAVQQALKEDPGIDEIRRHRVCVMLGDGWSKSFYARHGIDYLSGKDTQNCLDQVAGDRADIFIHAEASVLRHVALAGLEDEIVMLSHVYDTVPLTLLVSRRSEFQGDFVKRFDEQLTRMKEQGEYDELLERLRAPIP